MHLFAAGFEQDFVFIRSFAILGASGGLGPKLRQGDRQVPEGIYPIAYLNPNSIAHLSLALGYPNEFDLDRAAEDGRASESLGGDIMIHGGMDSIGCLAIGDQAAEDLFVLAADAGLERGMVVVSPVDFRRSGLPADYRESTRWVTWLYAWIAAELDLLPLAPPRAVSTAPAPP